MDRGHDFLYQLGTDGSEIGALCHLTRRRMMHFKRASNLGREERGSLDSPITR